MSSGPSILLARAAVVGHVEWLTHGRGLMPRPGEIAYLADAFDEPAGGGAVAAAQVAKLGAECLFFTALGWDDAGRAAASRLADHDVTVLAAVRQQPQTRAVSSVDQSADRAILVLGGPTSPRIEDPLPWDDIADCGAAYFTGHDSATLAAASRAPQLVVTARRLLALIESGVRADVLVASASDPAEAVNPDRLPVEPEAIVWTQGSRGGRWELRSGGGGRWEPAPLPGPAVSSYGCGDSFAGGLTVGLARGMELEAAIDLGARCGAACLTGRGALGAQLSEDAAAAESG